MQSNTPHENRRLAALEKLKSRYPPRHPNISAARNGSPMWPRDVPYYAIPFESIPPNKLTENPEPVTGDIVLDISNTILYLRKTTGIQALGSGYGYILNGVERAESVLWLSGHKKDSTPEQRAHAAQLLAVDPSAIILVYNQ